MKNFGILKMLLSLLVNLGHSNCLLKFQRGFITFSLCLGVLIYLSIFAAHAQVGEESGDAAGNLLLNYGFESGQLSPWAGYGNGPNPPGVVNVQNCCAKGGTWSSYVQPNGQYYEMYQERATAPRVRYNLRSFIKTTGGLTGHLAWYSNVINDQECGSTNSATYVKVRCELVIPPGNQNFNVHLYGTEGGGKRAISDRWKLNQLYGGNDIIWNELRIDQAAV